MADTERTPAVGDTVLLEGLSRTIVEITKNGKAVRFDNPAGVARQVFARNEDGTVKRDANGKKIVESGEPSRGGSVAIGNLDLLMSDPVVIWGVRGRVDAKQVNPDAVVLTPAEHNINKAG